MRLLVQCLWWMKLGKRRGTRSGPRMRSSMPLEPHVWTARRLGRSLPASPSGTTPRGSPSLCPAPPPPQPSCPTLPVLQRENRVTPPLPPPTPSPGRSTPPVLRPSPPLPPAAPPPQGSRATPPVLRRTPPRPHHTPPLPSPSTRSLRRPPLLAPHLVMVAVLPVVLAFASPSRPRLPLLQSFCREAALLRVPAIETDTFDRAEVTETPERVGVTPKRLGAGKSRSRRGTTHTIQTHV
mmetsp:Transcript_56665/g.116039  ORF Transcript_56665/g.116039 Transcript_56665/m.116039 type:complete len:238 (+) Transcript_56665:1372-2085(+)